MKPITLDATELSRKITVTVTHLEELIVRTKVATWLIRFASLIAPFHIDVREMIGKPCLLYCPYCGMEFSTFFIPEYHIDTKACSHCNRQCLIESDGETARTVKEPAPCDYNCGYVEPYGFVPEAGCPIHDGAGK